MLIFRMQAVPSLRGPVDLLPKLESAARVLAAGSPVESTQTGVEGYGIRPTLMIETTLIL